MVKKILSTMKNTVFLLLLVFLACDKDKDTTPADNSQNMQDCQDNSLTDSLAILDHVLGSWTLIGYNCGFCPSTEQPTSEVTFSPGTGKLSFRRTATDTLELLDFRWSLEKVSDDSYRIVSEPYHEALVCEVFCDDHIFYNHNAWDGSMFLYERD